MSRQHDVVTDPALHPNAPAVVCECGWFWELGQDFRAGDLDEGMAILLNHRAAIHETHRHVAVDLDGTIAHWEGDGHEVGSWMPGAQEFIHRLLALPVGVIVHSCRATWPAGGGVDGIAKWLAAGGFNPVQYGEAASQWEEHSDPRLPTVLIWYGRGKPIASAYVDDRGVAHTGDFEATLSSVQALVAR